MTNRRGGLGRGLAALIPPSEDGSAGLAHLDVDRIRPNPRQPRTVFDDGELEELASSIRDLGLLQPVVVRPVGAGWSARRFPDSILTVTKS